MAVHYPRGLVGRIKASKLRPVAISIGDDLQWMGGVSQTDQLRLLAIMQEFEKNYPLSDLKEARSTIVASNENGVHPAPQTMTVVPAPSTVKISPNAMPMQAPQQQKKK